MNLKIFLSGCLIGAFTSIPFFSPKAVIAVFVVMGLVGVIGIGPAILKRKDMETKQFASNSTSVAFFVFIGLLFLSTKVVTSDVSGWNIVYIFYLAFYVPFWYIAAFLLGLMSRNGAEL